MRIKRLYNDTATGPVLQGIDVRDPKPVQHFTQKFVMNGLMEGWLTMQDGTIVLHTVQGDVRYTIAAPPGRYTTDDVLRQDNFYRCTLQQGA